MLTVRTVLKASPIDGLGVFADEPIKKGQLVWQPASLLDTYLNADELARLPDVAQEYIKKYCYTSKFHPGMIILEFDHGRFINHSDNPNTDFSTEPAYALRDIAVGEEITGNYRDYEDMKATFHTFVKK